MGEISTEGESLHECKEFAVEELDEQILRPADTWKD